MKQSLRQKIHNRFIELRRVDPERFVNGGQVEKFAERLHYKPSNASRRLRELENDGILEVRYRKSDRGPRTAWYRLKPEAMPPKPPQYEIRGNVAVMVQ